MNEGRQELALRHVHVSFNGFKAINGLDFKVAPGELRCLIGPNGAGKTTALDVICGKVKVKSGSVVFKDQPINQLQEHQIARRGIGRKFQVPSVFGELSVRENLEVANSQQTGVLVNLLKFGSGIEGERLDEIAALINLEDRLNTQAGHLSHGQTQWLEIGMLLAQFPKLILMDEPTAGMTRQETHQTAELFHQLKGKHTLIVVEHDMGFVKEIGDIISVMHQGRLLAEGTVGEIEQNQAVRDAYLGTGKISNA